MNFIIFLLYILLNLIFLLNFITTKEYYPKHLYERVTDFDRLHMNELNKINCIYPLKEIHVSSILVFLLCRDKLYATYYSIKYWLKLARIVELNIVILDHYTIYSRLIQFYKLLSNRFNIHIHYLKETNWIKAVDVEIPLVVIIIYCQILTLFYA